MAGRNPNRFIPNEFAVFTLSRTKSPSDVTLRSTEWAVITQIDGQRSLGEIAEVLALSKDEAVKLFTSLFEKGLLEIISTEERKDRFAPPEFFEALSRELTKIVGPVAPFLIDDAIWELEGKKDRYHLERIPELIETISDEISDETKQVRFQEVMLTYLKELNNE